MEVWKDVKGYEGHYQVSNLGRIKTLKKQVGRKGTEKLMTPYMEWNGYSRVALYKDKKPKQFIVHRLVAEAFIPNPEGKPVVDHINGDRTDNRVENLRWCTHSENSQNSLRIKNNGNYKTIVIKDNKGNIFKSYREAAREYGIAPNTVKNDVLGKTHYTPQQKGSNYERKVRFERG